MARKPPSKGSDLEQSFRFYWKIYNRDVPIEEQYRFDEDGARYRFDFAIPEYKIAIEVEGGIWNNGGHVRGSGYLKDCDKYNLATLQGWRILRFTTNHIERDPESMMFLIRELIEKVRGKDLC